MIILKNYSINEEMSHDFIMHYKIVDDLLIVNYGNGEIRRLKYSTKNEKELLQKMKHQVLDSKLFLGMLNTKWEIYLKLIIYEILFGTLFGVMMFVGDMPIVGALGGSLSFGTGIIFTSYKLNDCKKLRDDLKKNLLFVNNENNLNEIIRNEPEFVDKIDYKYRTKAINPERFDFSFTLNTIDSIEYDDLDAMYKQIEEIVDRPKILKKSKK